MELAEKERIGGEVGRGRHNRSGGGAGAVAEGEVRRSSRARTQVVNYADESAAVATGGAFVEETTGDVPRENVSGGATALGLLEMLGLLPANDDDDDGNGDDNKEDMEEGDCESFYLFHFSTLVFIDSFLSY